jgi:hypothetical protein
VGGDADAVIDLANRERGRGWRLVGRLAGGRKTGAWEVEEDGVRGVLKLLAYGCSLRYRTRPAAAGKGAAQPSQPTASYTVSESGVWAMRVARICASCLCSSAVSASPRALAMNRSSTGPAETQAAGLAGERPITFVRRLTSSSDRSSRFVERRRLRSRRVRSFDGIPDRPHR